MPKSANKYFTASAELCSTYPILNDIHAFRTRFIAQWHAIGKDRSKFIIFWEELLNTMSDMTSGMVVAYCANKPSHNEDINYVITKCLPLVIQLRNFVIHEVIKSKTPPKSKDDFMALGEEVGKIIWSLGRDEDSSSNIPEVTNELELSFAYLYLNFYLILQEINPAKESLSILNLGWIVWGIAQTYLAAYPLSTILEPVITGISANLAAYQPVLAKTSHRSHSTLSDDAERLDDELRSETSAADTEAGLIALDHQVEYVPPPEAGATVLGTIANRSHHSAAFVIAANRPRALHLQDYAANATTRRHRPSFSSTGTSRTNRTNRTNRTDLAGFHTPVSDRDETSSVVDEFSSLQSFQTACPGLLVTLHPDSTDLQSPVYGLYVSTAGAQEPAKPTNDDLVENGSTSKAKAINDEPSKLELATATARLALTQYATALNKPYKASLFSASARVNKAAAIFTLVDEFTKWVKDHRPNPHHNREAILEAFLTSCKQTENYKIMASHRKFGSFMASYRGRTTSHRLFDEYFNKTMNSIAQLYPETLPKPSEQPVIKGLAATA